MTTTPYLYPLWGFFNLKGALISGGDLGQNSGQRGSSVGRERGRPAG